MQICKEKIKIINHIDDELEENESESDIDNDEYDEYFIESILIVIINAYIFRTDFT